jgi:hypothetical protein
MPRRSNVLLPFGIPDTKSLRRAAANILRDIQREHEETDQQTADNLGVSVGTIRNELSDIGALTLAKIGAVYGEEAVEPYKALYSGILGDDYCDPRKAIALANAALVGVAGPKAELDALPAVKECMQACAAFITAVERKRLRSVA